MMIDVVNIGILVADVIAKPVDSIPGKGLLSTVNSISMHSGGCAMSAAIDMSILGLNTALIGKVGNDIFGDYLKNCLVKYKVNIDGLVTDDRVQTSCSVVLSDSSGERSFLHCTGTNAAFSKDDIDWQVVQKSKFVFVAGAMLMDTFDGQQCADVLKRCKELNKVTILDTAWDSKNRWMSVLEPCMPYIDVFLPSLGEAEQLSGETDLDKIADVFFRKGVKQLAIKLGEKGCYIRANPESAGLIIPAYKVEAVDTTGAGDSFCAGFITGLVKGMSFIDCGRFANAVGAHCVSSVGATTGIKPYKEIMAFMEANS